MPINVFGNSSNNSEQKIDTSLFAQKPYLRTNFIERNIEEDIDLKNQYRIKNLPNPVSIWEAVSKQYVDNKFDDPSIIKNTAHVDFNDKNLDNVRFVKVNSMPAVGEHLTAKYCVDKAISDRVNEQSLLRLDPDEKLEQDSILLNSTLTSSKTIVELPTKNYVDKKFNDSSIIKNIDNVDFNDKDIDNVGWIKVNNWPRDGEHLTPKLYVDNAIHESSLLRLHRDEELKLDEQDSILLDSILIPPNAIIELPTKSYVDSLHEINRDGRYLSSVFNDQDSEFDNNKLTNLDSITVNRNPNLDNELSNKKYVDDSIGEGTLLRFNQTLENYLKVSVGNDIYNLTKYDKIQIIDTTEIKYPNIGSGLLQKWNIKCNNKNNISKVGDFLKSTKTNSPTGHSGASSLPPIGNSFMYKETSSNNHGSNVFVSWERTDIIQISNITLYFNRFSILTNDNLKNMGRFRIQLLLDDNTWSTQYTIAKNTQYSNSETEWKILNLDFTTENYGIKLILDQIDTAHSDMCFSNITITHSVY